MIYKQDSNETPAMFLEAGKTYITEAARREFERLAAEATRARMIRREGMEAVRKALGL